ncbi:MAG: hypothetical protein IJM83_03925, partial [Firmicutes bacterium]|nr:hypothetical protein [Bacillota bacterium]
SFQESPFTGFSSDIYQVLCVIHLPLMAFQNRKQDFSQIKRPVTKTHLICSILLQVLCYFVTSKTGDNQLVSEVNISFSLLPFSWRSDFGDNHFKKWIIITINQILKRSQGDICYTIPLFISNYREQRDNSSNFRIIITIRKKSTWEEGTSVVIDPLS